MNLWFGSISLLLWCSSFCCWYLLGYITYGLEELVCYASRIRKYWKKLFPISYLIKSKDMDLLIYIFTHVDTNVRSKESKDRGPSTLNENMDAVTGQWRWSNGKEGRIIVEDSFSKKYSKKVQGFSWEKEHISRFFLFLPFFQIWNTWTDLLHWLDIS